MFSLQAKRPHMLGTTAKIYIVGASPTCTWQSINHEQAEAWIYEGFCNLS